MFRYDTKLAYDVPKILDFEFFLIYIFLVFVKNDTLLLILDCQFSTQIPL